MSVGLIGLGNLGLAIARRLMSEGVDLVVWNRTRSKSRNSNAPVASSPADLISRVDILLLNLADSNAVEAVLESENGLLSGDCRGKIIIDTTTNHFDRVAKFYRQFDEKGASYLECPVSGSIIPASKGELTILVSGDRRSFDATSPLLRKIGKRIFYLERPGLATKMKLVTNLVLGSFMVTLAEAIVLGENAGIEKGQILEILSSSAGNSALLNNKKEKLLKEDFSPHFSSAMMHKDLNYVEDLAKSLRQPLFTGLVSRELFSKAMPMKIGDLDFSAVYKILKEM